MGLSQRCGRLFLFLAKLALLCYATEMMEPRVFDGTVREIRTRLAALPDDERVRVIVGHPSLTTMARRLQATAAGNGMTAAIHDALIESLDHER